MDTQFSTRTPFPMYWWFGLCWLQTVLLGGLVGGILTLLLYCWQKNLCYNTTYRARKFKIAYFVVLILSIFIRIITFIFIVSLFFSGIWNMITTVFSMEV